ncbi:MAG: hypothetical protein IKN36_07980, partial [Clostridia bacterium]|nr:hypothetical protein [Clostridia bacterium]
MKEKLTLQEKLKRRKYKTPSRFVTGLYDLIGSTVLLPKYNPHIEVIDDINEEKGACFIVWNHLSRLDHLYTMKAAYPKRYNMVAGYSEFFRGHLHLVFRLNQILPKKVYTLDRGGIKAISSVIAKGGAVAMSPEGMSSIYGTNQPVVPGSGKFLKHYKVPVYFLEMRGQYLTSTKHCLEERKGRTEARLYKLFTPEQLEAMTGEQIEDKLNEVFRHDDYEWSIKNHIKWEMHGRSCEHLDEICYRCPRCGADLAMSAGGDEIKCEKCCNGAKMNDYYELLPFDADCVIPKTPSKWVELERVNIIDEIRRDPDYSFTEHVKVGYLPPYKYLKKMKTSEECGEGELTFDHSGIHFRGTRFGETWDFDLSYATYYSLVIMTSTAKFSFYVDSEFYEFTPDTR